MRKSSPIWRANGFPRPSTKGRPGQVLGLSSTPRLCLLTCPPCRIEAVVWIEPWPGRLGLGRIQARKAEMKRVQRTPRPKARQGQISCLKLREILQWLTFRARYQERNTTSPMTQPPPMCKEPCRNFENRRSTLELPDPPLSSHPKSPHSQRRTRWAQ